MFSHRNSFRTVFFFWRRPRRKIFFQYIHVLLLTAFLLAISAPAVEAGKIFEVQRDTAQVIFPVNVRFNLEIKAPAEVEKITLLYGTNAQTCQSAMARQNVEFETTGDLTGAEWIWDLRKTGGLPPGGRLLWQWEVLAAGGETFTSEPQEMTIEDSRYAWHKITTGTVAVYWVDGDAAFGRSLHEIGSAALARISREMGIEAPDGVRLMVYPGVGALQNAGINLPGWAGGFAVPEYYTVMLAILPNEVDWARSLIPHELAHLVSERRVFNCMGTSMPTWLSEGLSMVAEGPQVDEERELVLKTLRGDRLPALCSLANGFAANSRRANLAYAQSGMVVRYLLKTYGAEGLDALLQAIQDGNNVDRALESNFGFDTDGLDAAWRSSLGFTSSGSQTPQPAATRTPRAKNTAIPTLALWTVAPLPTHTPTATATPATVEPSATPDAAPASVPAAGIPVWPFVLAGLISLSGAVFIWIRRHTRR